MDISNFDYNYTSILFIYVILILQDLIFSKFYHRLSELFKTLLDVVRNFKVYTNKWNAFQNCICEKGNFRAVDSFPPLVCELHFNKTTLDFQVPENIKQVGVTYCICGCIQMRKYAHIDVEDF